MESVYSLINILALHEDSTHFWAGIQNEAETAIKLREDEKDMFGPTLFQTSSPLREERQNFAYAMVCLAPLPFLDLPLTI